MSTPQDGIFVTGWDPSGAYYAVFDDNGKVAYGYLCDKSSVLADVWLYNVAQPPDAPEWISSAILPDDDRVPYLNPAQFVKNTRYHQIEKPDEVELLWKSHAGKVMVEFYLRNEQFAILTPGAFPGWCANSIHQNEIAKPLAEFIV